MQASNGINTGWLRWKTLQTARAPDAGSAAVENASYSVSSTSYTNMTGYTVDIQGDGTSRVIVLSVSVEPDSTSRTLYLKCIRTTNGVDTDIGSPFTLSVPGTAGTLTVIAPACVDSPDVGAHTYRIQGKGSASAVIAVDGNLAVR